MSSKIDKNKFYNIMNTYINSGLRKGQAAFCSLNDFDHDLAQSLTGTEFDCFYDDNKLSSFLKKIGLN